MFRKRQSSEKSVHPGRLHLNFFLRKLKIRNGNSEFYFLTYSRFAQCCVYIVKRERNLVPFNVDTGKSSLVFPWVWVEYYLNRYRFPVSGTVARDPNTATFYPKQGSLPTDNRDLNQWRWAQWYWFRSRLGLAVWKVLQPSALLGPAGIYRGRFASGVHPASCWARQKVLVIRVHRSTSYSRHKHLKITIWGVAIAGM